jgi:hypothetical protein
MLANMPILSLVANFNAFLTVYLRILRIYLLFTSHSKKQQFRDAVGRGTLKSLPQSDELVNHSTMMLAAKQPVP